MRAPIFIIGYPRSGTSFVGKLIAQFTGYRSHGESHTLTLLQELHHQINLYRRRTDFTGKELVKQLDLDELKQLNTAYFQDFYSRTYCGEPFIDKTPGAVACHGWRVVKEAFPDAVFVACIRSPVEVIESSTRKFSGRGTAGNSIEPKEVATGWVGAMRGIENLLASEFSNDSLAIDQLELRSKPQEAIRKLFDFLQISQENLGLALRFGSSSREDVLTDSIDRSSYKKLSESSIPQEDKSAIRTLCEPTCLRWGIEL